MTGRGAEAGRFTEYLEALGRAVGHADRREPLRAYMAGLLLPGERKSVEPMAAKVDPRERRVSPSVNAPLRSRRALGPLGTSFGPPETGRSSSSIGTLRSRPGSS